LDGATTHHRELEKHQISNLCAKIVRYFRTVVAQIWKGIAPKMGERMEKVLLRCGSVTHDELADIHADG
jgi:hypothetical protein